MLQSKHKMIQKKNKEVEQKIEDNNFPQQDKIEPVKLIGYKQEVLEALLNYLDTKPHREVRGLIDELSKGQPVEV